jgi:hypothetical protein
MLIKIKIFIHTHTHTHTYTYTEKTFPGGKFGITLDSFCGILGTPSPFNSNNVLKTIPVQHCRNSETCLKGFVRLHTPEGVGNEIEFFSFTISLPSWSLHITLFNVLWSSHLFPVKSQISHN